MRDSSVIHGARRIWTIAFLVGAIAVAALLVPQLRRAASSARGHISLLPQVGLRPTYLFEEVGRRWRLAFPVMSDFDSPMITAGKPRSRPEKLLHIGGRHHPKTV